MKVKYYDLESKRVFITGGGSGIGASIVEHFCEQGSEVYFIDINEDESKKLIEDIKNKNYILPTFIKCDLLNIKELQKTIADIISEKGPIDILINNAANDTRHKIDDVTEEYWDERMNVNLRHFFFTVQSVKKSMIDNGGGAIINMGSTSWMVGQGGMAAYTAAKSGVVGLTRSFARDLGEFNIRVNSVVPGWVMTQRQMDLWLNDESEKELMKRQCLKEKLMPKELAQAVLFFSSEQSSGCTNQSYVVDKGWL
jgi:NAD(P)-dependent dehydrogenase (short-subunit alcohol dehydrogenase family)